MSPIISAEFETRREAELAVEHIIQEYGVGAKDVTIVPVSERNSAGTRTAGSDTENQHLKQNADGEPALAGRLKVSAQVDASVSDKVRSSFSTYGGKQGS